MDNHFNNLSPITLGTYNMSFASDKGADPNKNYQFVGSERRFLNQMNMDQRKKDSRLFWENSLNHLMNFIRDHRPICVGLQEMNIYPDGEDKGVNAVNQKLQEFNEEHTDCSYKIYSDYVTTVFGNVGIAIIINEKICGSVYRTDDEDELQFFVVDNRQQKGRPISILITDNGFVFINMHGAQKPELTADMSKFNNYMNTINKNEIYYYVNNMSNLNEILQKIKEKRQEIIKNIRNDQQEFNDTQDRMYIFVMGDMNDRYDAIKEFDFNNGQKLLYNGNSPYSCCHNIDSSCNDTFYTAFEQGKGYGYCKDSDEDEKDQNKLTKQIPSTHGIDINNYRYKGDKIFGKHPLGNPTLNIYKYNERSNTVSNQSDHELVYGTFGISSQTMNIINEMNKKNSTATNSTGGKSRKKYIKHKKKSHKKKSRKKKSNKKKSNKKK